MRGVVPAVGVGEGFSGLEFRRTMGRFATGVTVVSMLAEEGAARNGSAERRRRAFGITVNAFMSVSLEPPLIAISIDKAAHAHATLASADRFAVSVLAEEQRHLSDHFAGRRVDPGLDPFVALAGFPVVDGAVAHIVCRSHDAFEAGDHTIFIGEVEALRLALIAGAAFVPGDVITKVCTTNVRSTRKSTIRGRRRARMACRINCRTPRHPPNPGSARMVTLGTPLSPRATRVLLLGSGELGKEVAIELQRFGVEVIAADRYADAPAMQVAHRSHVLDMLDGAAILYPLEGAYGSGCSVNHGSGRVMARGQAKRDLAKRHDAIDAEMRDIERTLEANAATVALLGCALGASVDRRFFAIPAVVAGFLLQHAIQGWCPPLSIFRRLGVKTAAEIAHERYALKALRGDFADARGNGPSALKAARA